MLYLCSMIYFIGNKNEKVVKIGYTDQSIKQRFSAIQNSNHKELETILVLEGMKNTEQDIPNTIIIPELKKIVFI